MPCCSNALLLCCPADLLLCRAGQAVAVAYHSAERALAGALEQPGHLVPASDRPRLRKQLQDVNRRFGPPARPCV